MIATKGASRPFTRHANPEQALPCPPCIRAALRALTAHMEVMVGAAGTRLILTTDAGEPLSILTATGMLAEPGPEQGAAMTRSLGLAEAGLAPCLTRILDVALDLPPPGRRLVLMAQFDDWGDIGGRGPAMAKALAFKPLIEQFARAWVAFLEETRRATQLLAMFDMVDTAILLVDRNQQLLQCNESAAALLTAGDGLRQIAGSVTAVEIHCALRLQTAVAHSLDNPDNGRAPVVAVGRKLNSRPLLVAVTALQAADQSVAMLTIFDPARNMQAAIAPASKFYGLSPVETRLATLLVEGASLGEAASTLRIREPTARTYLKHIFFKTDVRRQSDLVRLLIASSVSLPCGQSLELL